jgi:hypothetical protein
MSKNKSKLMKNDRRFDEGASLSTSLRQYGGRSEKASPRIQEFAMSEASRRSRYARCHNMPNYGALIGLEEAPIIAFVLGEIPSIQL